ncbi:hypothetical protein CALCODRAFT_121459 [Calocera cornea HHB12733]|uniref:Uncharacterized protein n=1 Tax=Calocera cornea HHB12733 TaxID=1353952 RepID=A0A165CZ71_9BASI|nr:hypothetical protein CALCODRAFT_121459 [Calocera cornea HHB12733]
MHRTAPHRPALRTEGAQRGRNTRRAVHASHPIATSGARRRASSVQLRPPERRQQDGLSSSSRSVRPAASTRRDATRRRRRGSQCIPVSFGMALVRWRDAAIIGERAVPGQRRSSVHGMSKSAGPGGQAGAPLARVMLPPGRATRGDVPEWARRTGRSDGQPPRSRSRDIHTACPAPPLAALEKEAPRQPQRIARRGGGSPVRSGSVGRVRDPSELGRLQQRYGASAPWRTPTRRGEDGTFGTPPAQDCTPSATPPALHANANANPRARARANARPNARANANANANPRANARARPPPPPKVTSPKRGHNNPPQPATARPPPARAHLPQSRVRSEPPSAGRCAGAGGRGPDSPERAGVAGSAQGPRASTLPAPAAPQPQSSWVCARHAAAAHLPPPTSLAHGLASTGLAGLSSARCPGYSERGGAASASASA